MSTVTPNLGLTLQAHAAPNWDTPLNTNFTIIDGIVGGGVGSSGNVLTSNGPGVPPTYQPPAAPGVGTVTSVGLTTPGEFSVAGSPVTSAGTLAISKANQSANLVYAGPASGGSAQPTFRALAIADMPFQPAALSSLPGWWGSGDGSPWNSSSVVGNGQWATPTPNQIKFWTIRMPFVFTINKLSYVQNSALGGSVGGYGIYDSTGQVKQFSWDNVPTGVGGGLKTFVLGATVVLQPGLWIVACGCSLAIGGGGQPATGGGYQTAGTNEGGQPWNANGTVRTGVAANPLAAGVMPASLGLLSVSGSMGITVPLVIMEP